MIPVSWVPTKRGNERISGGDVRAKSYQRKWTRGVRKVICCWYG